MNKETITRKWDNFIAMTQRGMSIGEVADYFEVDTKWLEREFGKAYRQAKAEGSAVMRQWLWKRAESGDNKAQDALFKLNGLFDE